MLTFKAKTLAAKSKSRRRRLNPHLNKTCRGAAGKKPALNKWPGRIGAYLYLSRASATVRYIEQHRTKL